MTADLRAALSTLVAAFERHLEVAALRRNPDDQSVIAAAQALADAFDEYDELLFETTDVPTPLAVYEGGDEDEDGDDEEDEEDEDGDDEVDEDGDDEEYDDLDDEDDSDHYFGLDDEEYDEDDEPATGGPS